jgi:DNA-binding response OmpR family regulator
LFPLPAARYFGTKESCSVRVLVIEDYKPMAMALKRGLQEEGFAVDVALDGLEGREKTATATYDVILLDLMLPKIPGLRLLEQWRRHGLKTPVLILTARGDMEDRVQGLNLGADDFMTKPFQMEELLARLRALVRRGHRVKTPNIRIYDLEIDTVTRKVNRAGQPIALAPLEYALLELLAFRRGEVLSSGVIREHLFDELNEGAVDLVDEYISHLRNKIDHGFTPPLILTSWDEGYQLRGD